MDQLELPKSLDVERHEMADRWSQLGWIRVEDLNEFAHRYVTCLNADRAAAQQFIWNDVWAYDELNEDTQELIDAAIALDYPELFAAGE